MAYAYLLDPQVQYMTKSGTINVGGYIKVYDASTDDSVVTYKDFTGTENTEKIMLDNNGRCICIADSDRAYRVEVYDRYGTLLWTVSPLWCMSAGGGVDIYSINVISSDGSLNVDKIQVGSRTTYDLSTRVEDSTDLLGWIRTSGQTLVPTNIYKPTYVDGTMMVGDYGVQMEEGQYYHVTAHINCTKVNTGALPWTDDVNVHFKGRDRSTGDYVTYKTFKLNVDYSMMLPEEYECSLDVKPESDIELVVVIDDKEVTGGGFYLTDMEIHRVYSGAPYIPGGVQRTLVAGENITIDPVTNVISSTGGPTYTAGSNIQISGENVISATDTKYTAGSGIAISDQNVISATGGGGPTYSAGQAIDISSDVIGVKVDGSTVKVNGSNQLYADIDLSGYQEKLTPGSNITISNNTISATDTTYSAGTALELSGTTFNAKVDGSTVKVNGSNQLYADFSGLQQELTPGSNITINNNTISATDTDTHRPVQVNDVQCLGDNTTPLNLKAGSNVTISANGGDITISASGGSTPITQLQSNWTESNSSSVQYILNKPSTKPLTAGTGITITELVDQVVISGYQGDQADWTESNSSDPSYIRNKPDLSVYALAANVPTVTYNYY